MTGVVPNYHEQKEATLPQLREAAYVEHLTQCAPNQGAEGYEGKPTAPLKGGNRTEPNRTRSFLSFLFRLSHFTAKILPFLVSHLALLFQHRKEFLSFHH